MLICYCCTTASALELIAGSLYDFSALHNLFMLSTPFQDLPDLPMAYLNSVLFNVTANKSSNIQLSLGVMYGQLTGTSKLLCRLCCPSLQQLVGSHHSKHSTSPLWEVLLWPCTWSKLLWLICFCGIDWLWFSGVPMQLDRDFLIQRCHVDKCADCQWSEMILWLKFPLATVHLKKVTYLELVVHIAHWQKQSMMDRNLYGECHFRTRCLIQSFPQIKILL